MLLNVQERRTSVHLASLIDESQDLAEVCGWRYAIAYLISEQITSPIIQRLLSGGGRIRLASPDLRRAAPFWRRADTDTQDMTNLFNSLRERQLTAETCDRGEMAAASNKR